MQDIFVTTKDSKLKGQTLTLEELKEIQFYMPRKRSMSTYNFFESLNLVESDFHNIRNIQFRTMIEIIKNTKGIGLITKEYIKKELTKKEIIELKTSFKIKPIEYGIYINSNNKLKEIKELVKIFIT